MIRLATYEESHEKSDGQLAYEIHCSIFGIKANWELESQEAWESFAQMFLDYKSRQVKE